MAVQYSGHRWTRAGGGDPSPPAVPLYTWSGPQSAGPVTGMGLYSSEYASRGGGNNKDFWHRFEEYLSLCVSLFQVRISPPYFSVRIRIF